MIKIITAFNNPKLNNELNKNEDIEVIGKDIFYKEGILEILEKEKNINYIIIDYNLPGENSIEEIVKKIIEKNKKIKIIILIKKENKINLNNKNIKKIIYENKIDINNIKNYILNKNNLNKNIINNKNYNFNKMKNLNELNNFNNTKIINFIGTSKSGKTITIFNILNLLNKEKIKILIIEMDEIKRDLSELLKNTKERNINIYSYKEIIKNKKILLNNYNYILIENLILNYKIKENIFLNNKNNNYKIINILILKPNILEIKENLKIIEKNKINNLKILINNYNKYSIDENILKNIFKNKKIIGKINYNENYENIINNKIIKINNEEIENIIKII